MIYLTPDDLDTLIKADILEKVTSSDPIVLARAEQAAIEEATSYLNVRHDVAVIFAATGAARNAMLTQVITDLMLYHLHSRINPRQIPDLRADRYEAAVNWLSAVAKGRLKPNLPTRAEPDTKTSSTGEKKRHNRY